MTHLKEKTKVNEENIIAYQLTYKVPITNAVAALRQMKITEDANKDNPAILLMDISHYVENDILIFKMGIMCFCIRTSIFMVLILALMCFGLKTAEL